MAGASREHNQISANLIRALGNQLLDKPCSVYSSDMKVRIEIFQRSDGIVGSGELNGWLALAYIRFIQYA